MQDRKHVLIVDEDAQARGRLASHLEQHGLRVTAASNAGGMQRALERARIDLVLLDVLPDDGEGLRLCRHLRASSDVPVIVLARRADEVDRIVGLEMGADDFLVKSVNLRELLARIRNILRRTNAAAPASAPRGRLFRFGGWQLDIVARELSDPQGRIETAAQLRIPRVVFAACARQSRRLAAEAHRARARARRGAFRSQHRRAYQPVAPDLGDDARVPRIIKTVHGEGYVIGVLVERA